MKYSKKLLLKIFSGIIAFALIGGILFITIAFVGNPVSAMMATKAIKKYVNQNYSTLDLEVEKAKYNFKDGGYTARTRSKTSVDTKFSIYYKNGKVQQYDYESNVLRMFNTLDRLSQEYSSVAKKIIADDLGYANNKTRVMYDKREYESTSSVLKLDMEFDRKLPLDAEVIIAVDLKDNSISTIAKLLEDAHKAFVKNECIFNKYSLGSESNGVWVEVNNVTPKDIENGQLLGLLEKAQKRENANGILFFTKGEKK